MKDILRIFSKAKNLQVIKTRWSLDDREESGAQGWLMRYQPGSTNPLAWLSEDSPIAELSGNHFQKIVIFLLGWFLKSCLFAN